MKAIILKWRVALLSFLSIFAFQSSAFPMENPDSIAFEEMKQSISSLESRTVKLSRENQRLLGILSNRDSVIQASLWNTDAHIQTLQDSIKLLDGHTASIINDLEANSNKESQRFDNLGLLSLLCIGLLIILIVLYAVNIIGIKKVKKSLYSNDDSRIQDCMNALATASASFNNAAGSCEKFLSDEKTSYTQEKNALSNCLAEFSIQLEDMKTLLKKANDEILVRGGNVSETEGNKQKVVTSKPDKIAYDAAVDAWININNHLYSLGKDRKHIQHVYALLAGQIVSEKDIKDDLSQLSDERKESVNSIISDIKRFNEIQKPVIETWLSGESGNDNIINDIIRFPLGQSFNGDLDEELTGDDVDGNPIVLMVASLGYIFPGSRNGNYYVKSKVLV